MSRNNTITAIICMVVWIALMVAFGAVRNIKPDFINDDVYQPDGGFGHPLYQEY